MKDCDVLLTFVRRTTISGKAIDDIKKYVASGKPLVALRTSSHGFQSWPEFDKEVLGGNYNHHYKGEPEKREIGADGMAYTVGEPWGSPQTVTVNPENKNHPVLEGITDFVSKYSLYKTSPIASDAKLLLTGKTEEGEEPVAWTRDHNGSRIVYIALGGVQDWKNPIFVRLVTNALFWAADFQREKEGSDNENILINDGLIPGATFQEYAGYTIIYHLTNIENQILFNRSFVPGIVQQRPAHNVNESRCD